MWISKVLEIRQSRAGGSEIPENLGFGRMFRMAALRSVLLYIGLPFCPLSDNFVRWAAFKVVGWPFLCVGL